MTTQDDSVPTRTRWARLRFSIIGPLLACPAKPGELQTRLMELANRTWQHPTEAKLVNFSMSTIERWYYAAKTHADPLLVLERKTHAQAGTHPSISLELSKAIFSLYKDHPAWSYQLYYDNVVAMAKKDATLGTVPSYATVRRFMNDRGMYRKRKKRRGKNSESSAEIREMRSYEVCHVQGLWHLDFHEGSRKVLTTAGEWEIPILLGILDDHSRLACHLQWYLAENTENLVHGFSQAIQKRGRPRSLLSDNGSAMVSAEFEEGLERLSILHPTTLAFTPEQNGKQEHFWNQVEGRLMAMLEGEDELTLAKLNEATQAWVELEYNRRRHSEIGETPLERYLRGPSVSRPSPNSEDLRRAFRTEITRKQRRSDGTLSAFGVRFELPSRYRALTNVKVRIARWDLSSIDLVDPKTGRYLTKLLPLDKEKNADGKRRIISPDPILDSPSESESVGIAPHLQALMEEYASTGLPPAYLPQEPMKKD